MSDVRHFLVHRVNGKLDSVDVYDDTVAAMRAYAALERDCGWFAEGEQTCVLLGADRLGTCIATHGNWFDEPTGIEELLA